MAFFDKTEKRIKELSRALVSGKGDTAKITRRIEELRALGPVYVVDFYDGSGNRREERCPDEYQSERGAARYHALCLERVRKGAFTPRDFRKAKIADITNYYLQAKLKKSEHIGKKCGYLSSKSLCKIINRHIGHWTLERMDQNPEMLQDHFYNFPEPEWSPKYVWNYFIILKAAINHWIRFRRLLMKNPCEVVELDPQTRVLDYTPTREDFEKVYNASIIVGLPDLVRHLLIATYETGLRINEVLSWRIEDLDLSKPVFDEKSTLIKCATFKTEISKQRRKTKIRIPMSYALWDMLRGIVGDRSEGFVFARTTPPYRLLRWLRCPECGARKFFDGRDTGRNDRGRSCKKCNHGIMEAWSLCREAGVPFERPFHDFRKSVKHRLKIEMGLSKEISKNFMGHKTDSMDDYYCHLSAVDLLPAVEGSWRAHGDTMETWNKKGDSLD